MERGNPAKEHMTALHDPIDRLLEGQDVLYTGEEPEELR